VHSYLKQSTASQSRSIGPFLDDTDFKTAETGLTIANTDIKLMINGAASANKNSGGGTHRANGVYGITFDATDTATVGEIFVSVVVSGALPVFATFVVVEEAVYDMLFGASALGYIANAPVNVAQISGDGTAADNLENAFDDTAGAVPWQGLSDQGTAQAAGATSIQFRAGCPFTADDVCIGQTVWAFGSTQGYWQDLIITDYVAATKTATVDGWVVTPSGTISYKVAMTAPASGSGSGGLDAAGTRAALGMASANLDTQLSGLSTKLDTIDDFVDTEIAAIKAKTDNLPSDPADESLIIAATDAIMSRIGAPVGASISADVAGVQADTDNIQTRLPAALVGGRMDASVGAMAANTMTAAAAAADLTTELQSGLATAAALATTDGKVDGIKAKTDSLTFTTAGMVDAAIKRVGNTTLNAAGTGGQGYGA